jgi:hypothetical protein
VCKNSWGYVEHVQNPKTGFQKQAISRKYFSQKPELSLREEFMALVACVLLCIFGAHFMN